MSASDCGGRSTGFAATMGTGEAAEIWRLARADATYPLPTSAGWGQRRGPYRTVQRPYSQARQKEPSLGTDRPMGRTSRRCPQRVRTYQSKRQGKRLPHQALELLGPYILDLLRNRQALFLAVRKEDALVGAYLTVKAGRRFNPVLGGVKRLTPDACVGYFAHFQLMLRAQAEGMAGYDLVGQGDEGVNRSKDGFRALQVHLARSCHLPLGRARFSALKAVLNFVNSNVSVLSRIGQMGCAARAAVTAWVR